MANPAESTCWTVIAGAAAGDTRDRDDFAARYRPALAAYFNARWTRPQDREAVDDAVQDVFVEAFRDNGALSRVDATRPGGFRAYLYGIARNIARRTEKKRATRREVRIDPEASPTPPGPSADDEARLSRIFDRAWAATIMREAASRQRERAADDDDAQRRIELLRLRFREGLPIRDIAAAWDADPVLIHREYARARKEFRAMLLEVVAFHHPGDATDIEREAATLLDMLE